MADRGDNPENNRPDDDSDGAVIEGVSAHYEFGADDVMPAGDGSPPAVVEDVLPDTLVLLPLPLRFAASCYPLPFPLGFPLPLPLVLPLPLTLLRKWCASLSSTSSLASG